MIDFWRMAVACEDATHEMMLAVNDWSGGERQGREVVASARKVVQLAMKIADEFSHTEVSYGTPRLDIGLDD